jgi:hypothetical protein
MRFSNRLHAVKPGGTHHNLRPEKEGRSWIITACRSSSS